MVEKIPPLDDAPPGDPGSKTRTGPGPRVAGHPNFIGRTLGDFALRQKLAEGGFGSVYLADQLLLNREAVVKVMHSPVDENPEHQARFLREARLASSLDHPFAAHVYSFGAERDGTLWIAMEFVRGTPLNAWIKTSGSILLAQFVPLFEKICDVVHTLHQQGIVHRDLKPANVMVLVRAGRLLPKLLDLGIAKLDRSAIPSPPFPEEGHTASPAPVRAGSPPRIESDGVDAAELTQFGVRVGSPHYMAPEQWRSPDSVDLRTDIYALGVVAYEMLSGQVPFAGKQGEELGLAHSLNTPCPLTKVPLGVDAAIQKALAKNPRDRFPDALSFARALRRAAGPLEIP